jgi:hypothetical protein
VKVRKYIIKAFAMQMFLHHSYFVWLMRTFYKYCTSRTHFKSWSIYRYCKRFGDLNQRPWHVEKHRKRHDWNCLR